MGCQDLALQAWSAPGRLTMLIRYMIYCLVHRIFIKNMQAAAFRAPVSAMQLSELAAS